MSMNEGMPQPFYVLQHGTPRNGPEGTLAGVAEPGARLDVPGHAGGLVAVRAQKPAQRV